MIELRSLSVGYNGAAVLEDVSLRFTPGRILALLGPNGCGKSTLLRSVVGLQEPLRGEVLIDGTPAAALSARLRAQRVAYLAQSRPTPNISAERMVLHGRFPHLSFPRRYREEDRRAARDALAAADAAELAPRQMPELSGGQRQKIYLAMALAQDTDSILMDEPTTYLDVRHQLEVMRLARRLADEGRAVVLVLHDLCLALRFADEIAVFHGGRLHIADTPEAVFRSGELERAFSVELRRVQTECGWQYFVC